MRVLLDSQHDWVLCDVHAKYYLYMESQSGRSDLQILLLGWKPDYCHEDACTWKLYEWRRNPCRFRTEMVGYLLLWV